MRTAEAEIERLRVPLQQMNNWFEAIEFWRDSNYCALRASPFSFEIILADELFPLAMFQSLTYSIPFLCEKSMHN